MKKDFLNNFGLVVLLLTTLFFVKIQIMNNSAYAGFQSSFNFLLNVLVFIAFGYFCYLIYKHFISKDKKD
ncbi:hypothetical protein [Cytophaga aurantiaca]|uniref:hypothetical protein n=1 Tax=Cytophaga aurantiaca TaxID=29530 RepID=UPI000365153A|nr:hypothetical protein [Cytophaga aurantiaca]